ncbi:hypothetical protein TNCV_1001701 [Trichonephila clavipes]|nr:hypothetical protein TNCV_1001701 [Trichonephila clavipes]
MMVRCDGNPDHYERNRRFRHLVPVLGGALRSTKSEATAAGRDFPPRREAGGTRTAFAARSRRRGRAKQDTSRKCGKVRCVKRDMWQTHRISLVTKIGIPSGNTSVRCSKRKK